MPNPFGPLGDIFVEPFGVEPKPLVFQTSEHGPPIRKLHIKYKNAPNHLCDRSAFFFIKLWKILFIRPFDITQFIYNSCKTEAAKTKMSCMLSHCIHILLSIYINNNSVFIKI